MKRLISWLKGLRLFNLKTKINNAAVVNKIVNKDATINKTKEGK
jgi:hypothetical protein